MKKKGATQLSVTPMGETLQIDFCRVSPFFFANLLGLGI